MKLKNRLFAVGLVVPALALAGCGGGGDDDDDNTPNVPSANVLGLTSNNRLLSFNSQTPRNATVITISGLAAGENMLGIDYRYAPSGTGTVGLYGLSRKSSGNFQLYRVTPNGATATLTAVGAGFQVPDSTNIGFDFNPNVDADPVVEGVQRVDRIRLVSTNRLNARLNPDTGGVVDSDANTAGVQLDGTLTYATDDTNATATPQVTGAAYTNNDSDGTTGTTNYAIDIATNSLVTQGRAATATTPAVSPNTGQLFTVGTLGSSLGNSAGFDIGPSSTNLALAAFGTNSNNRLYQINLTTGRASSVGTIDDVPTGSTLIGLAILPN